jgi:hypothetical protein
MWSLKFHLFTVKDMNVQVKGFFLGNQLIAQGGLIALSHHKIFKSFLSYGIVLKTKLHGLSPQANYTDRATAACQRSDCQLVWIEGATWSA